MLFMYPFGHHVHWISRRVLFDKQMIAYRSVIQCLYALLLFHDA